MVTVGLVLESFLYEEMAGIFFMAAINLSSFIPLSTICSSTSSIVL